MSFGGPAFAVGGGALWLYLCCAFVYGETFVGVRLGGLSTALIMVLGVSTIFAGSRFLVSTPARRRMALGTGVACATSVFAVLAGDFAYTVSANYQARGRQANVTVAREADPTIWHGELFPRHYYPTDRNFYLYKPGVQISATTYGEFYQPDMLLFPVLANEVLESKPLSYHIGPLGLRGSKSLGDSRIVALGDSFAMGYGTDEGKTWTDLLSEGLGEPVFNAGVSSSGPRQQLFLLKYLFETQRDSMRPRRLLWMLFEGNDLESSYEDRLAQTVSREQPGLLDGTILGAASGLPRLVKNASVVRKAVAALAGRAVGGRFERGGITLPGLTTRCPLYHSERWGYRLFNPLDVECATKGREYVLSHSNRPRLEATVEEMADLSREHGFRVTVIIAPSASRMYGPSFDDFPEISKDPHFIRFVAELALSKGFDVVDLLEELRPTANEDLLYYRDDHHWNARGNQVVAEIIERALTR